MSSHALLGLRRYTRRSLPPPATPRYTVRDGHPSCHARSGSVKHARPRTMKTVVLPLTPERWRDLETVFGARGCSAARSCWCMAYRKTGRRRPLPPGMTRATRNRADLKALVDSGKAPGLIAYWEGCPVGWISIEPRQRFPRLGRSPVTKPVDDKPVWSVVCFVIPSEHRHQGIAHALLQGAIAHARKHGGGIVEGYPVDKPARSSDSSMWLGAKSMYDRAGFKEVARRQPARPVVRLNVRRAP